MSDTGTMNNVNNIGYLNYAGLEALVNQIKNRYDGTIASIVQGTRTDDANVIYFNAVNGNNVYTLDTTDFIKDGMLSNVELTTNASNKSILRFTWNIYAGDNVQDLKTIDIPVEDFINTGTVTELQNSVAALSSKVDGFEGTVNTLSSKVDGFENNVAALSSKVDGIEGTVNALSSKVDGFEGTVNALSTSVNALSSRVDGFEDTVNALSTSVNALSSRVDGFEDTVNALSTSVNALSSRVDDFENTYLKQESFIDITYIEDLFKE